jgi:hypothetical protein
MPLPQRFHVRCFDPTRRWPGRLRAALDPTMWRVVAVDSCAELLANTSGSAGASPSQIENRTAEASPSQSGCSPALLLCVLDETNANDAARWWSLNRARANLRSPLIVVANSDDDSGLTTYWQELGATVVITTTLEIPLVVQLAERFASNPENREADAEHPLTPFWQALPWTDALPKAGPAR